MNTGVMLMSIGIVCVALVFLSGCSGSNPEKTPTPTLLPPSISTLKEGEPDANDETSVVEANNKFSFNLYSHLSKDSQYTHKSLFFSPFSISSALAITYEGARGNTADEIQSVFFFPNNSNQRRQGYEQLYKDINKGNSRYVLKTANALWVEKSYPFLSDYIETASMYYNTNASNLDFLHQPENSRITINTWVENQTNNKIMDLIPVGAIDPLTRLIITNAVYFKGTWVKPFDKNQTKDDNFNVEPGKTVRVPMMQKTDNDAIFRYTETASMQVLEMPYATDSNKQISMIVFLPKNDTLASVEESLTAEKMQELNNALIRQRVNVSFPKFKLETKYSLPGTFKTMGMLAAFADNADFSGMDGTKNLYIGDVIHQAFIEVNEEGTEAAAATGVILVASAIHNTSKVPEFRADHPFIFIIQDDDSGNILFMGRVTNPNGE